MKELRWLYRFIQHYGLISGLKRWLGIFQQKDLWLYFALANRRPAMIQANSSHKAHDDIKTHRFLEDRSINATEGEPWTPQDAEKYLTIENHQ